MFDFDPFDGEARQKDRAAADRRYNEALTALDAAVVPPSSLPARPPSLDETKLPAINDSWRILQNGAPHAGRGWRARLAAFVWRLIGPILDRQQHFNALIVEHLNRNVAGNRLAREALAQALPVLQDQLAALTTFQSLLLQFLQQVTAYADTKDRDLAAHLVLYMSDRVRAVDTTVALVQQQQLVLKREIARLGSATAAEAVPITGPANSEAGSSRQTSPVAPYKYFCFEREFRGSEEAISARLEDYCRYFIGASDVLDVGCGRGEFLELLAQRGVRARGLDLNREMVERCKERGLDVIEGDAVSYLQGLPDGSLGGLFAAQVVEHFEPAYLIRFLDLAYERLRSGSKIVLETINVDCWSAFFGAFLRDITHVRPLPSDTLKFLLQASGFQRIEVIARSRVPEASRLHRLAPEAADALRPDVAATLNANTDRLNDVLFTHLDYAAIGERL
jgi:cyclopropane fatty-acyl-phospholipid synthase-like methyltransferase